MATRTFTVFQDVPTTEPVKAKSVPLNVMVTRSSARSNNILQGSSSLTENVPIDKENVHPVTGERAGTTAMPKKRKTNVLSVKSTTPLASKKVKSIKETKGAEPHSKKHKATSEVEKSKAVNKEPKAAGSSRKPVKRVTRKAPKLPRLEEETSAKSQEAESAESAAQAEIDSRCYDLTVKPLADVSQAYDAVETAGEPLTSSPSKPKFRKDTSAEPELRDFFPSSQTHASLPSTSTARASSSEPAERRKFSTPERKQIYAAFTFSTPSPASERFKSSSPSSDLPRLELA
ncbi:hypothetical protein NP233_g8482 [Leucocoprinus birnbaumii]|uniref:Uncharacterized protein n=1 Tax=Leucocoprinus birnbaumii TaxID=56174 RepID=A0AAD5YP16_9AGAR|nr:hypothetical protein NP233_g8482 [Leucocoprinus birnbaumii]